MTMEQALDQVFVNLKGWVVHQAPPEWQALLSALISVAAIILGFAGLFALTCRWMKSTAAAVVSSSIVSIRLRLSGPVSSILPSADALSTPRGELLLTKAVSFFG